MRTDDPQWQGGVRQRPLTPEEVGANIRKHLGPIQDCYARERLNTPRPSSFFFQLDIPPDGSTHTVTMLEASDPAQLILTACVSDVLRTLEFPAHNGEPLQVKVPLSAE